MISESTGMKSLELEQVWKAMTIVCVQLNSCCGRLQWMYTPFYKLTPLKYNAHICMVIVFTYILHARINCMDAFFILLLTHLFPPLPITHWLKHFSRQTNLCICHSWIKPPCLPLQCKHLHQSHICQPAVRS